MANSGWGLGPMDELHAPIGRACVKRYGGATALGTEADWNALMPSMSLIVRRRASPTDAGPPGVRAYFTRFSAI